MSAAGTQIPLVLDRAELRDALSVLAKEERLSGSIEERRAFDFARELLTRYGIESEISEHPALVGYPIDGSLAVDGHSFVLRPHAMAPSTPQGGLRGELVDVGAGRPEDFESIDVRGKIILARGLPAPARYVLAANHGAIGQVYALEKRFHEMIVSPVWGTATEETSSLLPRTPSASILEDHAVLLRDRMKDGRIEVTMQTEAFLGWVDIPRLTAVIPGESNDFVLLSSHIDSWHEGAIDNATGNLGALAVTASMAGHHWQRGLKLALWSGHSHGRYAGSAYFVDEDWDELERHCVAHVNLDGLGSAGSKLFEAIPVMSPAYDFVRQILLDAEGVSLARRPVPRAGDHSLMGLGVPAIFNTLSEQPAQGDPAEAAAAAIIGSSGTGGAGLGWFWHSIYDTIDRYGDDEMVRDAKFVLRVCAGLCAVDVLPWRFSDMLAEVRETLSGLPAATRARLRLDTLREQAEVLQARLAKGEGSDWRRAEPSLVNAVLKEVGHELIPVVYSVRGRHDQDLALSTPILPGLVDAARLESHETGTAEHQELLVTKLRQRNRLASALRRVEAQLDRLEGRTVTR